jgi:hypothetical protein
LNEGPNDGYAAVLPQFSGNRNRSLPGPIT